MLSAVIGARISETVFSPALLKNKIRNAVDYIVPAFVEKSSSGLPSQIIKLELDGQFKIIRP